MRIKPLTLKKANEIVTRYHRTTGPVHGHKFSVGLFDAKDKLVAVGIAGRPTARTLDDGQTIEIAGMRHYDCPQEDNRL